MAKQRRWMLIPPSPPDLLKPDLHNDLPHTPTSVSHITCFLSAPPRCIFERSLKLLHRGRYFRARGFDVAILRNCHVGVPQDSLDGLVGDSKLVKIRRQAAAKRMPPTP